MEDFKTKRRFQRRGPAEKKDEFDSKLLDLARVARVSKGGRHFRFRAVMVVGDKAGKVGVGVAKGVDVAQAVEKSTRLAKKHLITVNIVEETIPHETEAKFGASRVLLKPQRKGRGLVAGGVVRVICTLAGIRNISSKIISKTKNKLNNAHATIEALKKLRVR
ncbi:MAG: 30S ribosomal protein S5 [bacterium]